jgi:hypothetical protein
MNVDEADLESKLLAALEKLATDGERIAEAIGRTVVRNLKVMARMGTFLEDAIRRTYPEFPLRPGVLSWEDYLPPLSENLRGLLQAYDADEVASRSATG